MMTNTDNVESSLPTSNLLKICYFVQVEFCYKLHMSSRVLASMKCVVQVTSVGNIYPYSTTVYYCLHGSTMGCSLKVTRAGVAG